MPCFCEGEGHALYTFYGYCRLDYQESIRIRFSFECKKHCLNKTVYRAGFSSIGKVHLVLREDLESVIEDHYEWNKVTTCVHNLFGGGQRWVDQYGEMIIKNANKGLTCKMSFVRVSYCIIYPPME